MGESYKRKPNTNCFICKKPIYRRPFEIQRNKKMVFCSMVCYGISCRKEIPCVLCGKPILSGLNKKTCSRGCANRHRAGMQYKINRPRDRVKSQHSLKIKLLKKRGRGCEQCNYDKYEILQIHHKDRNKNNNNINNLELLCPNCHFEKHYLKNSWLKNIIKDGGVGSGYPK